MIQPFLSEIYERLPKGERLRIQKDLGIIFPGESDSPALRRSLKRTLQSLYAAKWAVLKEELHGEGEKHPFHSLLRGFGRLREDHTSEDAGKKSVALLHRLKKHPLTLWPEEDLCTVPGEALEVIMRDPLLRNEGFLLSHIHHLPAGEKRAWTRWLRLEGRTGAESKRNLELYFHLMAEQSAEKNGEFENHESHLSLPLPMEELFPDDPAHSSMAWFYRGILPLYGVLEEMEKTGRGLRSEEARKLLEGIKKGGIALKTAPERFNEPVRYIAYATKERVSGPTARYTPAGSERLPL